MPSGMRLELQVNGKPVVREIEPQELLLDVLRDRLGLTGAKRSCDMQVCGVCTVLVDGRPVSSCCFLAADAEGGSVLTIEGLAERPEFDGSRKRSRATRRSSAASARRACCSRWHALLETGELTSVEEVKRGLAGNLCRCTGYRGIVEAVCELAGVTA